MPDGHATRATARHRRRPTTARSRLREQAGGAGDRISASGNGARCARTTARTAPPGTISRTIMRAAAPIAGARTASPDSATTSSLVPVAGALERPRPDPEGAAVRPDQRAGQSRRGRQGTVLSTSTARRRIRTCRCSTSIRRPRSRTSGLIEENAARRRSARVSKCSTPACSMMADTSTSEVEYAKHTPDDIADARQRRQTAARISPRRCTCCRSSGRATDGAWSDEFRARP